MKRPPGFPSGPNILLSASLPVRLSPADGDDAGQRTRPGANRMPVIAGFNHPCAALLADNLADMVRPDHDRADTGRPGPSPACPAPRQVEGRAGIAGNKLPHFPTAPRSRPPAEMPGMGVLT